MRIEDENKFFKPIITLRNVNENSYLNEPIERKHSTHYEALRPRLKGNPKKNIVVENKIILKDR
jgi:hypothetical protein